VHALKLYVKFANYREITVRRPKVFLGIVIIDACCTNIAKSDKKTKIVLETFFNNPIYAAT